MEGAGTPAAASARPNGDRLANHGSARITDTSGPAINNPAAVSLVRSAGRDSDIVAFEVAVVSFFIDAAEILGIPKSVAAIYGMCFASPLPLSFVDLNARLEISQGSVSQGLKALKEMGALKVLGAHDRREYFAPDMELRKLAVRFLDERLEKQFTSGRAKLDAMKAAIPDDDRQLAKELRPRIKHLQNWYDKSRALLPVVKTILKLT